MSEDANRFEEEINLRDYFRVISKRRWTILAFFLTVVIITAIASFKMTPFYKAEAKILLDEEKLKVVTFQDVLVSDTTRAQYYTDQREILKSRTVAKRVIEKLNLEKSPEFAPEEGANVELKKYLAWVRARILPDTKKGERIIPIDPLERTVDAFLGKLDVTFVANSGVAKIVFYGKDPVLVANVANTLADLYIEQDLERKYGANVRAATWLDSKLAELRKNLQDSEYALQRYREANRIIAPEDKQNTVLQKLSELNTALTQAKTERIGVEILYEQAKAYKSGGKGDDTVEAIPAVVENDLIQKLKQEYVKRQGEYSQLATRYGEQHPKIVQLSAQMATSKEKIQQEVGKVIGSIETRYRAARAKEEALAAAFQEQKAEALDLNKKGIQYGVLKSEVESNRTLFDAFVTRLKETDLSKGVQSSNIRILDKAKIPESPARPKKKRNIAIAMVVGLMLGVGFAFLGEHLDTSLKTPDEVERYLEIPSIGVVNAADKQEVEKGDLLLYNGSKSRTVEDLLTIRTNVIFSFSDNTDRVLLVTSAIPVEGKSFIAKNLATSIANLGKNVLIVDADMRKPVVHKAFKMDASPGLSDVLVGENTIDEAIKETFVPHLSVLPSGTIPPNPLDLIGSDKMLEVVEELKKRYAWIIFDTPPLISVADAAILAGIGARVLIVMKSGETRMDAVKQALKQIESANAKIIGGVLNFVDYRKERYYYSYYHKYYSYYYEEGTKKKKARV